MKRTCRNKYYGAVNTLEPASIRDLGLGKETNFKYPWNPSDSPIICEKAQELLAPGGDEYWNSVGGYPGAKCNEFIFSQA